MVDFISPSINVQVIDESIGATAPAGTVPLVFITTKSNKQNESGEIAEGTLPENAGRLELITSQRELLQKFGIPVFREVDGTTVQGDETNEYGLHAAYSYLGLANRCYIVRADLDTEQLIPTESEPRGKPVNGTYWFDHGESSFGLFVANGKSISGLAWDKLDVEKIDESDLDRFTSLPNDTYGVDGDIGVVVDINDNVYYEKINGTWEAIGSSAWKAAKGTTVIAENGEPVADATVVDLIINGTTVTISNTTTAADVATDINTASIADISAAIVGNALVITNTAGGSINLGSTGSALEFYGLAPVTDGISLVYSSHIMVPNGERVGSYWIKTTTPNDGAKFIVKRYNAPLDEWETIDAPFYEDDTNAAAAYGTALGVGSLYVQYNVSGTSSDPIASQAIKRYNGTIWEALAYDAGDYAPSTDPDEGTLWFNAALEADILVNTGNQWRGYRNVYPGTDPNGPQMTSKMPTSQSTGGPLVNYDLWIKTNEITGYPEIYRYLAGQWMLVDNLDRSTPLGVVFGDIRKDSGPVGPWIKGGTRATGVASMQANAAYVMVPGEGYTDGVHSVIIDGGVYVSQATADVTVENGMVTDIVITAGGSYSALPAGGINVTATGIPGSPSTVANFNISWGVESIDLTFGGAGYSTEPLLSIVGGGGVGAKAFTTINAGLVDDVIVTVSGQGYTSIPTVFINTPFGRPNSDTVQDMAVSDWNDPVDLSILNPQRFAAGMILFNTRRSTNNVKVWREEYLEDITEYTVGNFLSDAYELSNPGAQDAAYDYIREDTRRWVTFSGNDLQGVGLFGKFAQRICVVRALAAQVIGNTDIRSEFIDYNIIAAPGYVELFDELITLNVDRSETAFIIADTPSTLKSDGTSLERWAKNLDIASSNGDKGLINRYEYAAMYYPWVLSTNVDGREIVVPPSTAMLRVYGYSDSVSYPWYPPAGSRRGQITNGSSSGILDQYNAYHPLVLNKGQRDVLYENSINPITVLPQQGLLAYGNKTLSPNAGSALSRVNVARLVVYMRKVLMQSLVPILFELNIEKTRKAAQEICTSICVELMGKNAIYDFVVSLESNTPDTIDQNLLIVDVAIEPTRAVEFILVPLRISKTGSL